MSMSAQLIKAARMHAEGEFEVKSRQILHPEAKKEKQLT